MTCSLADFLASHLVMPGSDEARKMTATSGRTCLGVLTKCSPLGSLLKTLLESQRWSSKARYLKWQVNPLYSTRATWFEDNTDSPRPLPSNESATTSKVMDMKSNRYLFRLVPSEPPTEETGSSSSDTVLLQTPTTVQTDEPPEKMRERAERNGYKNGTKFGSLTSQIKYDERVQVFLKTPCAADSYTDTMKSKGVSGTSGTLAQEVVNGYAEKHRGLMMQELLTLQTPTTVDYKYASLSTTAWEKRIADGRQESVVSTVFKCYQESGQIEQVKDGTIFRLSPLFTEEMMGFPLMWTALPFLSESGEQKPLKPTATR